MLAITGICMSIPVDAGAPPLGHGSQDPARHARKETSPPPERSAGQTVGVRRTPDPEDPQPSSWSDPDRVERYLARISAVLPRVAGEEAMVSLLPDSPRSVLDLGCGDGRLAALVLEHRPTIERVVAVDASPAMLAHARERFGRDKRISVMKWDLDDPLTSLGSFDVVVAGCSIHHLDDQRKRDLFREVAEQLVGGGVFANLDVVASATPELHRTFLDLIGRSDDDPEDRLAPVESQLDWMRQAGLSHVDCLWRWRGFALLAGRSDRGAAVTRAVPNAEPVGRHVDGMYEKEGRASVVDRP